MKVVRKDEAPYGSTGEAGGWNARKIHAGEDSELMTVTLSHFLPGYVSEWVGGAGGRNEKSYYVVRGSMVVKTKSANTGEEGEAVLEAGDVAFIPFADARQISVLGLEPCTIVAVMRWRNTASVPPARA